MPRGIVRNLAWFAAAPLLGVLAPVIIISVVVRELGDQAFLAMAIGQGTGMAAALIGELGWSVTGPQEVAKSNRLTRLDLLDRSLRSKLLMTAPLGLAASVTAAVLTPAHTLLASGMALAYASFSLSSAWYFVGLNQPHRLLFYDTLPKVLAALFGALAVTAQLPASTYPAVLILLFLGALARLRRAEGLRLVAPQSGASSPLEDVRSQFPLSLGRGGTALYTTLPPAIVSATADAATATVFAAVDRVMRMGLLFLASVSLRFQSWLGASNARSLRHRVNIVLISHLAIGVIASVTFALTVRQIVNGIFGLESVLSTPDILVASLVVNTVCLSRGFGMAIVAVQRVRSLPHIQAAAALTSAIGLVLLPSNVPAGGFIAILMAELVAVCLQAWLLARAIRSL